MSTQMEGIVRPVKLFVKETLPRPLLLHEVPRRALTFLAVRAEKRAGGKVDLTDVLSTVKDALDKHLPFPWLGFASDVGAAFAQRGHFPENTQEASRP